MKVIVIALLTLVACITLAVLSTEAALEPGDLTPAHENISSTCLKCHDPLHGASARKCMDCHSLDQIGQIPDSLIPQFHRALRNTDCMGCHWLHADTRLQQTTPPFRHDFLTESFLSDCVSCHEESRPSDSLHLNGGNCGTCHSTTSWTGAAFDHSKYFRFDRRHPPICSNCHTVANDYSKYSCSGCHKNGVGDD